MKTRIDDGAPGGFSPTGVWVLYAVRVQVCRYEFKYVNLEAIAI